MTELGNFIKSYREEKKMTLREFADLCGLSHSYIDKLEKGIDPRNNKPVIPTIDTLQKIANATGYPLEVILQKGGYTDNKNNATHIQEALKDDPELAEFWEEMKERESLQILFKQAKNLDDKDIKQIIRIIKAIEDEEDRE